MAAPQLDPDFAALASAPAAPAPAAAPQAAHGGLDPDFAQLAGSAPPAQTAAPESWGDIAKDYASAAVRPVVKAATALPGMAADAATSLGNLATGNIDFSKATLGNPMSWLGQDKPGAMQMPSVATNQLLDQVTRAPTTPLGQAAEFGSTALLGSKLPTPFSTISNPAPQAFNAAAPAAQSALTGAQQQAMQQGAQIGMRVTPGQASGSKVLQQVEASLESQPFTSGPFHALKAGNQDALNRAAAQAIGEDSSTVDASVLDRANTRLGNVFNSVRSVGRSLPADPQKTSNALAAIDEDVAGLLPNNASIRDNPLVKTLEEILSSQKDINGKQLGQLSSKLGKAAYKQMSGPQGDRDLGKALYAVKDHVDDLVQQTLNGDEAAEYSAARQQYRSLMQLTSRVGTVNPSTGNVSGGALANMLQQTDKPGFLYGRNQTPLYQAARFAQAFKPLVGDSGTATRASLMPYIGGAIAGGGLGAAAPGHTGADHLKSGAIGALLGLGGLNLATRAYLTPMGGGLARGAVSALNAPRLLGPAMRPGVIGGLLAAQSSEAGQ